MVVKLGGYDHGGVLELDTIVVVVSRGRGRMNRKRSVVVVVAMERMVVVVTMHVLGRVLGIVCCGHERRMGVLWVMLLEELLLVVVVVVMVLLLVLVLVLLGLGWILGMLGMLGLLGLLGVIVMGVMELVLMVVLMVLMGVLGLGERGAVVDVVFLVGGRVRLAAIKARMVLMLVVILGV